MVGVWPRFSNVFVILLLFFEVSGLVTALFLVELPPAGAFPRGLAAIHQA
jgi:hypothetical protein